MSDNLPTNERPKSTESSSPSPFSMQGNAMWGGVALIGLGTIFLLQTMGIVTWDFHWWAFFILIPGLMVLYRAYQSYQAVGRLDHSARGALIGGSVMTMVGVIFLFDLSWDLMWPVMLIVAGVAMFITARA